jgi:hypothetical protein
MRDQKSTKIVLQGRPSFSGLSAILVEKPSASCNVLGPRSCAIGVGWDRIRSSIFFVRTHGFSEPS